MRIKCTNDSAPKHINKSNQQIKVLYKNSDEYILYFK